MAKILCVRIGKEVVFCKLGCFKKYMANSIADPRQTTINTFTQSFSRRMGQLNKPTAALQRGKSPTLQGVS